MSAQPIKVLLIEDNPGDAALIEEHLAEVEGNQFLLEPRDRLATGLERLVQGDIDVVLLDLSLPDSQGLATLEQALTRAPLVPILIMTGLEDNRLALEAVQKGAQDYLIKGKLTGTGLARALRYTVERHRAEEHRLQQAAELRLLTEQLPAIIWTTDDTLRVTSSLGKGLLELGLDPGELIGVHLNEYLQTAQEGPALAAHRRALQGESVSYDLEWRGRLFHVHIEPFRPDHQHIVGTIGIALDITDQRRVEEEFRAAQKIQQRLLPRAVPQVPGLEIAGVCQPAASTGGDFYDFLTLQEGALGILLADVSKHGFAPALIMASTRRSIRSLAAFQGDLGQILSGVNRAILEDTDPEHFVTLFFAQLEPLTRSLTYAGAGHEGYLFHPGRGITKLESLSFPLGVTEEDIVASPTPIALEDGHLLLMFTDGLSEAMSPAGRQLGIQRVLEIVQSQYHKPAEGILQVLLQEVQAHTQPGVPHDDITIVIVKVVGMG